MTNGAQPDKAYINMDQQAQFALFALLLAQFGAAATVLGLGITLEARNDQPMHLGQTAIHIVIMFAGGTWLAYALVQLFRYAIASLVSETLQGMWPQ